MFNLNLFRSRSERKMKKPPPVPIIWILTTCELTRRTKENVYREAGKEMLGFKNTLKRLVA